MPDTDPWSSTIPGAFRAGAVVKGCVKDVTGDAVRVELEHGVEGYVRLTDLEDGDLIQPGTVLQPGQSIDVRIVAVDPAARKIDITLKRAQRDDCVRPPG